MKLSESFVLVVMLKKDLACPHKVFCHMTEDTSWANQITSLPIINHYWAMLQQYFHTLFCYILPFQQVLAYKSIKVYATMLIGDNYG